MDRLPVAVHRGSSDRDLWWTRYDSVNNVWSRDVRFSHGNQSAAGIALIEFQHSVFCVHRGGSDDDLWWCMFDAWSGTWTADNRFSHGNSSTDTPALASLNNKLYCVYRGIHQQVIAGTATVDPHIYWCTFDPVTQTWSADSRIDPSGGAQSECGPALASYNGKLVCAFKGESNTSLYWCTFDPATQSWSTAVPFGNGARTKAGPALLVFEGTLYCVHRGTDSDTDTSSPTIGSEEKLWWCKLGSDNTWSADQLFSHDNESEVAPALGNFFGTLHCVHRGKKGDNHLWWCRFDTSSSTWSVDQQVRWGDEVLSADTPAVAVILL